MSVQQVTENVYIDSSQSRVFTFTAKEQENVGKIEKISGGGGKSIKKWGSRNTLPNYRDKLLQENNLIGELIATKSDILIGQGLYAYKEVYEDGGVRKEAVKMPNDWKELFEDLEVEEKYLYPAVINYYKHSNVFSEITASRGGVVKSLQNFDCKYIRASEKVNGIIRSYYARTDWSDGASKKDNPITTIQSYNKSIKGQQKYMLHTGDQTFHDGYYYNPAYWAGKHWIETSNSIPIFHKHNIENGYVIRYHIKYPQDYFLNKKEWANAKNDENLKTEARTKEAAAKEVFINKINSFLAGAEQAGRAIFTADAFDQLTKEYKGVEIIPLKIELKDESLLKLYESSNQANISAQGIHPTLANIESQGKLSSGSEIRNAFLFYLITKTHRPRNIILKPLNHILKSSKMMNDDIKLGFLDMNISKLSDDKSGVQQTEKAED